MQAFDRCCSENGEVPERCSVMYYVKCLLGELSCFPKYINVLLHIILSECSVFTQFLELTCVCYIAICNIFGMI